MKSALGFSATARRATGASLVVLAVLVLCPSPCPAFSRFVTSFLAYPAPITSGGLSVGDLNGDGYPDLMLGAGVVRLGSGDGSLGPPLSWPAAAGWFVTLGDLDGDGKLDAVTRGDTLAIAVLLGHGDGTFGAPVKFACAKAPVMAAVGRLDGDAALDVVTVDQQTQTVSIFLGAGDGTFAGRTDLVAGVSPSYVAIADLDGDGDQDLAVADRGASAILPFWGDGLGHFTPGAPIATVTGPGSLTVADLDADGHADLVVAGAAVGVQRGLGGGSFAPPATLPLTDTASSVKAADLDHDGILDLVVNAYYQNGVVTLRGRGDASFEAPRFFHAARAPADLEVTDMDRGGNLDVIAVTTLGWISVLFGNGDGTLGGLDEQPTGALPFAIAAGDLDGDGKADVVTSDLTSNTVSVLLGAGDGSFGPRTEFTTGLSPRGVTLADLNGDARLDLVVANSGPGTQISSTVSVRLGDGAGGFGPRTDVGVGRWPASVAVGDLNGDGHPDLAVAENDFQETLSILDGVGDGTFVNRRGFLLGSNASGVAIADATGDGHPDVVLGCTYTGPVFVLPGHGDGTFGAPILLGTDDKAATVAVMDYTRDGIPDVVAGWQGVRVYPGLGGGVFGPGAYSPAVGSAAAFADFDGDGRIDAATANDWNSNTVSVLLQQLDGSLAGLTDYGAGDRPVALAATDVNNDDLPDLVIANLGSSTISVVLNTGGRAWSRWVDVPPGGPVRPGLSLRLRPNPTAGDAAIDFTLAAAAAVTVRVYDVAGRRIASLPQGEMAAGPHTVIWRRDAASRSGVYLVELTAGASRLVRRAVLLR